MLHSDFVHLHVHTQYSLLDGACLLEKLIEKAAQFKMPALGMTDHGNLFGAIKFYTQCMKKGIKPIIGCEVYLAPHSRFEKDSKQREESNYHLTLLVKDETGYKNLIKLVSLGYFEGFYYKPRVDKELLRKYQKGLIALSGCLKGSVPSLISKDEINQAFKEADEYVQIFGKGNFYLEIMENGLKEQKKVNRFLLKIARDLDIPVVATNDVHYLEREDAFAHEVLLCIQTQDVLSNPNHFKFNSDTFYFRSPAEMKEIFKDLPESIKNTLEIMQKCNFVFDFSKTYLPKFPLPEGETAFSYLSKLCYQNLKKRYPHPDERVMQRLKNELEVIKNTGFSSYFLIVYDLIKFAKERSIPVGPGRGSSCGSIVSYLLEITDIDPLKYGLLFERFLNPQRISFPDIDIDFCYEKRGLVLDYVGEKYGKEKVAQIITFGTLLSRAVVRDVGRVMGLSYAEVDRIAKMIPYSVGHSVTLKEALAVNSELKEAYHSDERVKQLIDVALKLEGLSRHASVHAAGVVISDESLMERIPLVKGQEGEIVTGFDMEALEKIGMLKMDFLGLKTLTVIEETIKKIEKTRGIKIDIRKIPLDDKKTFQLLGRGETSGVFQLESRGMREILKKLVPTKFEDLIAVLALYRPGPLGSGMVDDFIQRKQGKKPISYLHPKLESILKETYGIILYQEQTLQIVSQLAGFSLSQADLLRKAIGKKIPEIMEEQKELFIEGCKKRGIPLKIASEIFDLIDYFSGYGFNKSHSTAYALISYRTAYLKANFTPEFMATLLTSERDNTDKIVEYVNEANRLKIKVLPPDINESFADFTVTSQGNIRFGLRAIKNVGEASLENILKVREEKKFSDFFDFCYRVNSKAVNKKVIESLIKSGAMDRFGLKRAQMMAILDKVLDKTSKRSKGNQRQISLFNSSSSSEEEIPDIEEWPREQILSFEKALLGFYVSSHPLHSYNTILKFLKFPKIASLYESNWEGDISVAGVINKIRLITTRKNNQRMAVIKLEDDTVTIEAVVFPKVYESFSPLLKESKAVIIEGKLEVRDKVPKILVSHIYSLDNIWGNIKGVNIFVGKEKFELKKLKNLFLQNKGTVPVYFTLPRGARIKAGEGFSLKITPTLLEKLSLLVGEKNLSLTL